MTETLYELEGTWEELEQHAPELQGRRLRVTVLADEILAPMPAPAGSLEDELDAIAQRIPKEEWDKLPADLSDQLDHYLYGTQKR